MKWITKFFFFLVIFSCLFGCEKDEQALSVRSETKVESPAKAILPASTDSLPEQALDVSFYPDAPFSSDEIRACLRNMPPGYQVIWKRNGEKIEGVHSELLPPGNVRGGDILTVQVDHGEGILERSVEIRNSPPEVVAVNFAEPRIHRGVDIVLQPVAEDPDGDPISFEYTWFVNSEELTDVFGDTLPGSRFHKGDRIAVKVVALDAMERGEPFLGSEFVIPGAPPRFTSEPPAEFASLTYIYRADVRDSDGDSVAFSLEKAPEGMSIKSETGEISWPLEGKAAGEYRVRVKATDSDGLSAYQEYSLVLGKKGQEG